MNEDKESSSDLIANLQDYACDLYIASLEWAQTSFTKLWESEHPDRPFGTERHSAAQNVGYVCLAYALEFAYKSLLFANGESLSKPTHDLVRLHGKLPADQRGLIEGLARDCVETESYLGFDDTQTMTSIMAGVRRMKDIQGIHVIELFNRYCANSNVKYLGRRPDLKFHDFMISIVDTRRLEAIDRLHRGILRLAFDQMDQELQEGLTHLSSLWRNDDTLPIHE